ncbi:hypothetical protein FYK55_14960 [Roseiconus nitratireducens]|uniref:Uncharacterized protein n=1 Tax=Roseiconus nitratireducens TaxID=2605748 RepID=A0A5M6D5T2_9BACT|nr:hypothetical protein [Roseiconus nitratireducens]KAA5542106.1 hypothetical protein FYK55_14960 [Roseiconus nitratireducens]
MTSDENETAGNEVSIDLEGSLRQARAQLPKKLDQYTILRRIEENPSGKLDFWYEVNDEGTRLCRRSGRQKLREVADKMIKKNDEIQVFAKAGITSHHIYENRYGTHLLSFTVSPESIVGEETVGQEQQNPFAAGPGMSR